ncbi:PEP-CTERM sorting domain-containing protein [Rhodopirellula sp. MGV]|uniref:PEP-CTERM sorting domain-containing protein n=1 Tax=Rhodopirellula sp. MGV TaxID=2023130 RepID=UPI000B96C562|nr:PEP-CTERM sorting domain-containing protein [Rhodopirellula sp. MGV]OYP38162.1 hypothetical protein CGZ80_02730 [Rhodopirellula sp. MGV]PNY34919.1 PEP-CTERM sorting domain-containing protein [Rhodopirellula baltica]
MIFSNCVRLLVFSGVVFAGGFTCRAEVILQFSIDNGNTFGNSFDIQKDSRTSVGVYLAEISPESILSDQGLLGFGLVAEVVSSESAGAISRTAIADAFDFISTNDFTGQSFAWEAAAFGNVPPAGPRLLLGEFDFDSIGEGTTTFRFGDIQPGVGSINANWLTAAGTELDQSIFGIGALDTTSLSLRTSAVPEPTSAIGLMAGSIAMLVRRRRRPITISKKGSICR